jgi:hypothetical protein
VAASGFAAHELFDEMTARNLNLNFLKIPLGAVRV